MKIIKDLVDEIKEELEGAGDYAERAMKHKGLEDGFTSMYAEMAQQEMGHVEKLHGKVQEVIKKYRQEHGEPPAGMQAIWDHEHKQLIQRAGEIRAMIDMARK